MVWGVPTDPERINHTPICWNRAETDKMKVCFLCFTMFWTLIQTKANLWNMQQMCKVTRLLCRQQEIQNVCTQVIFIKHRISSKPDCSDEQTWTAIKCTRNLRIAKDREYRSINLYCGPNVKMRVRSTTFQVGRDWQGNYKNAGYEVDFLRY